MRRFILTCASLLLGASVWAQSAPAAEPSALGVKSANILQLSDADSRADYQDQNNAQRGQVQPGNNAPMWRQVGSWCWRASWSGRPKNSSRPTPLGWLWMWPMQKTAGS